MKVWLGRLEDSHDDLAVLLILRFVFPSSVGLPVG
jgi:hypothetical protein